MLSFCKIILQKKDLCIQNMSIMMPTFVSNSFFHQINKYQPTANNGKNQSDSKKESIWYFKKINKKAEAFHTGSKIVKRKPRRARPGAVALKEIAGIKKQQIC
jgi:hypothetical protein